MIKKFENFGKPDDGIYITIEHLNNLRKKFNCYYSEIFQGLYDVEKIDNRLVRGLIWSVEKDGYLPSKQKLLEYQSQFDKENKIMDDIRAMASSQDKRSGK